MTTCPRYRALARATVTAAVLLLSATAVAQNKNPKWSGITTYSMIHEVSDSRMRLYQTRPNLIVRWKLSVFMGQPMVYCDLTWFISSRTSGSMKNLSINTGRIPLSVLSQTRFISPKIEFVLGWVLNKPWRVICDPGVQGPPQYHVPGRRDIQVFRSMSKQQRARAAGYNMPGSPAWGALFLSWEGPPIRPKRAMKRMQRRIKLSVKNIKNVRFDLSAVHAWYARQKLKKAQRAKKRLEASLAKARETKRRRELRASDATFWRTPEDARTIRQKKRETQRAEKLKAALAKATRKLQQAERTRKAFDKLIEQRRASVRNRPRPGGKVAKAEKRIAALMSQYQFIRLPTSHGRCNTYVSYTVRTAFHRIGRCRLSFNVETHIRRRRGCPGRLNLAPGLYTDKSSATFDFRSGVSVRSSLGMVWLGAATSIVKHRHVDPTRRYANARSTLHLGRGMPKAAHLQLTTQFQTLAKECKKLPSNVK